MMSAAAEQVPGGFSSANIQRAVDTTMNFLESNYHLSHATEEPLTRLRANLIRAISEVADNQLIINTSLTKWLRNLHNAAYEAEDVLDRVVRHDIVTGKRKVGNRSTISLPSPYL